MDSELTKKYEQFFASEERQLKSYIYRMTSSIEDTEEIYQESAIKVWKHLESFDSNKSSFRTWVYSIITNTIIDHKRVNRLPLDAQDLARTLAESNMDTIGAELVRRNQSPEGQYIVQEHIEFCFRCVSKVLRIEKQVTLILIEFYGFKIREVATILQSTVSKVKHDLANARKVMTDMFESRCALLHKKGVCDQCSELNGFFNGSQQAAAEKQIWQDKKDHLSKSELYELRKTLVKEINPLEAKGKYLHEYFGWIVREAIDRKK